MISSISKVQTRQLHGDKKQELSDQAGSEFENSDVRWVITVPAIWKQPAKQFMRQAAYQAGLASPENSEQLVIALEPEAASIYCRKLRLHQLIELSSKTAVNGYSASDTVGAGFAQGTSALSLPLPAPPFTPASRMPLGLRLFKGTVRKNQTLPKRVGLSSSVLSCPFPIWPFQGPP